jgi:eukaryotic-like serine/threonine-protein kinase
VPERWQQIEVLYQAARDPAQRKRVLSTADPELRREVESLLAQEDHAGESTVTIVGVGTQLGRYVIEAPLGKGGMGEVFRARDTRLGRQVAIKISQAQFSERFEREARAISALNHPNICTLYDVGPNYLVMELVEGETLAARLKKGALSVEQTLQYGAQIADALAAAHAKEITHRDLKPGNIMLSKTAGVKLLDFGLAKIRSQDGGSLTETNAVMGTPAYMAPEQLEGQEADPRSDIYSLGLVLYEAITRKRAVQGRTPPMEGVPERLAHIIDRCLAPEPDDRWQTVRDIGKEIEWAGTRTGASTANTSSRSRLIRWGSLAAAALLGIGIVTGVTVSRSTHFAQDPNALWLDVVAPPGAEFQTGSGAAISPDGRMLAFVTRSSGTDKIWIRTLSSGETRELPGTETGAFPFWSPDSRSIAYFAQGKLQRIDLKGYLRSVICDGVAGRGGTWNEEGTILFNAVNDSPLMRVSASGGKPEPFTTLDRSRNENSHRWPQFLPGGKNFLYLVRSEDPDVVGMYFAALDRPNEKVKILRNRTNGIYGSLPGSAGGNLFWVQEGKLMAQVFNPDTGKLSGDPQVLAQDVAYSPVGGRLSNVWVSGNGTLLYAHDASSPYQLTWYGRDGRQQGVVGTPEPYVGLRISPNGASVAVQRQENLWQIDLARGLETRITQGDLPVAWSPDGQRIALRVGGPPNLFLHDISGAGKGRRLTESRDTQVVSDWSPDGRFLLYQNRANDVSAKTQIDLWILPMTGDLRAEPYLQTPFNEQRGRFSPDSRWVAYTSDESGSNEIYVRSFPSGGTKWRVSSKGGDSARWRKDGRELFYLAPSGKLMSVPIEASGTALKFGAPVEQFSISGMNSGTLTEYFETYDVMPDGQRFLVLTPTGPAEAHMTVIANWQAALQGAGK